jgi:hypothetical protein
VNGSPDIDTWLDIGRKNLWIKRAWDPPFNRRSFHVCATIEELKEKLAYTNWSLGTAFAFEDLCFINQVDGGDEWLTIRHGVAFESITFRYIIERHEFEGYILRLLAATPEQCKTLTY